MSNIEKLIKQSRKMPPWAAVAYLEHHRYLKVRKFRRLTIELKKVKEAMITIEREIETRKRELQVIQEKR
ncbi:MAG: hypothetical protein N2V75_03975 [Methanophagales archaeon]|nr:hypothetical protein [Methanophagales archaeon]